MANPNDELNILNPEAEAVRRAIPFREYFKPMGISKEQKERRVKAAKRISDVFAIALSMMSPENVYGFIAVSAATAYLQRELISAYADITDRYDDEWFALHAATLINEVINATTRHEDDPYYTSDGRADVIAENDANAIVGYDELQEAVAAGFALKTWHGMMDRRERATHKAMEGTTIPIEAPFDVDGSFMMMPGDDTMGADAKELVNCRCWITFS